MAKSVINTLVKNYLKWRYSRIEAMRSRPLELQQQIFQRLLNHGVHTEWGRAHRFDKIRTAADFRQAMPLQVYEDAEPYITRMMHGEASVLWPGKTKWYAKSSGTSSNKSKFIPVTKDKLRQAHVTSGWDALSIYYHHHPDARMFSERNLLIAGSIAEYAPHPESRYGDVSAIMIHHMPWVGRPFYSPDYRMLLQPDWERKIQYIVDHCLDHNITTVIGVPTWVVSIFNAILEHTGKAHIHEVWPELHMYMHGGVGFEPYREMFSRYLPHGMSYLEGYNASEGYFAMQDDLSQSGLLLLTDNGVYYEFLPLEELGKDNPQTIELQDVEIGQSYAIVISTVSGLWRYMPGDTVRFVSTDPYRIKVIGRTSQYINAFGEELMVSNADEAIARAAAAHQAIVNEYTAAPIYMTKQQNGGHEWLIEFSEMPVSIPDFTASLDQYLQEANDDYQAKRQKGIAMRMPVVQALPKGTFVRWMKSNGKLGAQHKIPRLSNDRRIIEEILSFTNESKSYA